MKTQLLQLCILFLMITTIITTSCKKEEDDINNGNNQNNPPVLTARQKAIQDYNTNYLGSAVSNAEWTGSVQSCNPGTTSATVIAKTLQRINYFRRIVGLNDDITFDTTKNAKCQQAALMMQANNALNHYPPTSWTCYSTEGYEAAGASNIALGAHSSNAITLYIRDPGANNIAVGHRRWILFSKAKVMGTGSTGSANALWVLGNSGNPFPQNMPEFIAYPPKGYIAAPLVFPRWSFSIPNADFTSATVMMKDQNGLNIPCNIIHRNGGYGDRAIVWEPTNINTSSDADVKYTVIIDNVKLGNDMKSYSYDVIIFKP